MTQDEHLLATVINNSKRLKDVFFLNMLTLAKLFAIVKQTPMRLFYLANIDYFCIQSYISAFTLLNVAKLEIQTSLSNCETFKDNGKKQLKFGCYCKLSQYSDWTETN